MSKLDKFMIRTVQSAWFRVAFLLAVLLALAIASGAPACIVCGN